MSDMNENGLDGLPPSSRGQPGDKVLSYAPTARRHLPKWLIAWSMISLGLCTPLVIVNILFLAVPRIVDRIIQRDPGYLACIVAIPVLLNQALAVIGLIYFMQFPGNRRRSIWHVCLHVVVAVLAFRGMLMLAEQYVSVH